MSVKIGTADIVKAYVGTTQVKAICLGAQQIWPVPTIPVNLAGAGALSAMAARLVQVQMPGRVVGSTYSQSSVYSQTATYANMNNGNVNDGGTVVSTPSPAWIAVDTGVSQYIDHITVGYDINGSLGFGVGYTENVAVQGSNDGSAWTGITTTPTYASSGSSNGLVDIPINQTWRHIRLSVNNYLCATEFAVYNLVPVVHLRGDGTLSATAVGQSITPFISTVSPTTGYAGQTVTLTGSAFVNGNTTVTIGGVAATAVNVTSGGTQLTCVVPNLTDGVKNVVATNTPGGAYTKTSGFTHTHPIQYHSGAVNSGNLTTTPITLTTSVVIPNIPNRILIAAFAHSTNSTSSSIVPTVTFNAVAMTEAAGSAYCIGNAFGVAGACASRGYLFYMLNPPVGTFTLSMRAGATGANQLSMAWATAIYTGVTSVGSSSSSSYLGPGTSRSFNGGASAGQKLVVMLADIAPTAMSSFNKTLRQVRAHDSLRDVSVLLGDVNGVGGSETISAIGGNTYWGYGYLALA